MQRSKSQRVSFWSNPAFKTYILLAVFLGAVMMLGTAGFGPVRYLFLIGCVVIGVIAWRDSPGRHLEVVIILLAFTPFVRRIVDVRAGFDALSVMISGPMITMLVPCVELQTLIKRPNMMKDQGPFLLAASCYLYGALISVFNGDFLPMIMQMMKWTPPLVYSMWMLIQCRNPDNRIMEHASRAFLIVTPVMGIYGVEQYLDPAPWDRLWMIYSEMNSIGQPEPFGVRVFSTMNSPGSFATFACAGLLVFSFTKRGWQAAAIGVTVALALMLSQYRTAWISTGIGLAYCWLYPITRKRATAIAVTAAIVAVLGMTAGGPIGDVISQRFDTFSSGAQDGSAIERMSEYRDLYNIIDQYVVGKGFRMLQGDNSSGLVALDGTIITVYLVQGIFVGSILLFALCWAALRAINRIGFSNDPMHIVTGAVVLGQILSLPLAGITSGETGFLFWVFTAIATASRPQRLPYGNLSLSLAPTSR
jgi:hypothetical protein